MLCKTIKIWEKGKYQSQANDGFTPTLDTYVLKGSGKRPAVLVCPGGGYSFVSEREAEPIAAQFNAAGFHAFVLYYSVAPRKHPQPLFDAARAMDMIRQNALEWKVDENKIAACGFSAGGHLAASLGVHWNKPYLKKELGIESGKIKPNALILAYPVITSGKFAHKGTFENLLGEKATEEQLHHVSLERHIGPHTPPAFIWHTCGDDAVPVENSLLFADGMRKQNIPFELHIYPKGVHGLSLATKETEDWSINPHAAGWLNLCVEWLNETFRL